MFDIMESSRALLALELTKDREMFRKDGCPFNNSLGTWLTKPNTMPIAVVIAIYSDRLTWVAVHKQIDAIAIIENVVKYDELLFMPK